MTEASPTQDSPPPPSVDEMARRYRAVLLRYFARRNIGPSDAQDLAQEVFLRLAGREGLGGVDRVEGYLFTIAGNIATDFFRRARFTSADKDAGEGRELPREENLTPERVVAGRQELTILIQALNEMPERMRTIFALARFENIERSEIARRLGISKRLVEQQLTLATACLLERRERMK